MRREPWTPSGQVFVKMNRSSYIVTDMRSWVWNIEGEAYERVLGELIGLVDGHASMKAGRGNVDDIRGFVAWFRALVDGPTKDALDEGLEDAAAGRTTGWRVGETVPVTDAPPRAENRMCYAGDPHRYSSEGRFVICTRCGRGPV